MSDETAEKPIKVVRSVKSAIAKEALRLSDLSRKRVTSGDVVHKAWECYVAAGMAKSEVPLTFGNQVPPVETFTKVSSITPIRTATLLRAGDEEWANSYTQLQKIIECPYQNVQDALRIILEALAHKVEVGFESVTPDAVAPGASVGELPEIAERKAGEIAAAKNAAFSLAEELLGAADADREDQHGSGGGSGPGEKKASGGS